MNINIGARKYCASTLECKARYWHPCDHQDVGSCRCVAAVGCSCPGGVHDWSVIGWSRLMSLLRMLGGCTVVKLEVTVQSVKMQVLVSRSSCCCESGFIKMNETKLLSPFWMCLIVLFFTSSFALFHILLHLLFSFLPFLYT